MNHLLSPILLNPVSCGADGLLGDAHDAADVLVFKPHLVEDEEDCEATLYLQVREGVVGGLESVFFLDTAERGEVDGLIVVDEAFVVVVRPTPNGAVCLISLT